MASKRALEMYSWLDRNPGRAPAEIARVSRDKWGTQKRIAAAAEEHTRAAGDFGTLVHTACEQWATGAPAPPAPSWARSPRPCAASRAASRPSGTSAP